MTPAALLATTAAVLAVVMAALWLLSLRLEDASIVDIAWGPGIALAGWVAFAAAGDGAPRQLCLLGLATLWAARLGAYLAWRNLGKGEDPRYQAMRRHHGAAFRWRSLFTVFGLQAALQWVVSLPLQLAMLGGGDAAFGALDALGVAVFAVGLGFEAVGDAQLARFKADPANAGQVLDRGLWAWTRHPNYFGDCAAHWGLYAIACATALGAWGLAGPLVMTGLLLRVSGVALLERSIGKRRPAYGSYQQRVPAFFPRPPRRNGRA